MRSKLMFLISVLGLAAVCEVGARADDKAGVAKEMKKFEGSWTFESTEAGGKKAPANEVKGMTITISGDKFTVKKGDEVIQTGTHQADPSMSPKAIEATVTEGQGKGTVMLGIYEFDGDTLTVCFDPDGKKRPTEFKTVDGSKTFINVHKRITK